MSNTNVTHIFDKIILNIHIFLLYGGINPQLRYRRVDDINNNN